MRAHPLTSPTLPRRGRRCWESRPAIVACAVLLATLAAGCEADRSVAASDKRAPPADTSPDAPGDRGDPAADGTASIDAVMPSTAGSEAPTPTIGASSAEVSSTGAGPPILRAVRVGTHPGLDRLVLEFDGTGLPAWHVEYVDRPVRDCGSGDPVPVAGDAWLQVRFHGAHAHTPEGASTSGPRRREVGLTVLRELVRTCDFEAEVTWVAGLARPNPYTARALAGPSRLVIDIAH